MKSQILQLGVIGAGQMGSGIAQVAAQVGISVQVVDVSEQSLSKGQKSVSESLARLQKKGIFDASYVAATQNKISWSSQLSDLAHADFVIEAVPENEALKTKILGELNRILPIQSIVASNTSSISITRLAKACGRPNQFIGMHFMNPVPVMKLVEVIRGLTTSDETYSMTVGLAEQLGKTVTTSRDLPGFIANRILMPMINEAFFALLEGLATAKDIDTTMKLGMSHPMGPLELADFVGLDTCLAILEVLHRELGDSKYRPCPLLRQYVDAGFCGKKSGRGVYAY